jgi:hypothetical protein
MKNKLRFCVHPEMLINNCTTEKCFEHNLQKKNTHFMSNKFSLLLAVFHKIQQRAQRGKDCYSDKFNEKSIKFDF